ncbi:MAG: transcription factor FapR [Firmicutes bacterium]|jgi:acyl-coenzyme A thioesterase PaaI-like protein|nr:transcription factor FapR [Bacillota bacterium]
MKTRWPKAKRLPALRRAVEQDPFLTDEELAQRFGVSSQTIRLDRLELSIPDMRTRTRRVAEGAYRQLRAVHRREIVGELYQLERGVSALSVLNTSEDMVFEKSRVVRGHCIFAQAESLALAVIDAEVALTGVANIKYKYPVQVGQKLIARAEVTRRRQNKYFVAVRTQVDGREVFRAKFIMVSLTPGGEVL